MADSGMGTSWGALGLEAGGDDQFFDRAGGGLGGVGGVADRGGYGGGLGIGGKGRSETGGQRRHE
jgi:hypothetical protein